MGAVAQQLKAIAERRGWNHDGHRVLIDITRQVSEEGNRPDWFTAFQAAKDLHVNFYDDLMESDSIEIGLNSSLEQFKGVIAGLGAGHSVSPPGLRPFHPRAAQALAKADRVESAAPGAYN